MSSEGKGIQFQQHATSDRATVQSVKLSSLHQHLFQSLSPDDHNMNMIGPSAIISCFFVGFSVAFAPSRTHTSFLGRSLVVSTNVARISTTTTTTTTALSMNLFDRFTRVAKSNLNNILQNLEDPEKIMNQALEDMQVGVVG